MPITAYFVLANKAAVALTIASRGGKNKPVFNAQAALEMGTEVFPSEVQEISRSKEACQAGTSSTQALSILLSESGHVVTAQ